MASESVPSADLTICDEYSSLENNILRTGEFLSIPKAQKALYNMFEPFGKIRSASVMRDIHTGTSLGTAFVKFETHDAAVAAMQHFTRKALGGRTLSVRWANKKHDNNIFAQANTSMHKLFIRNIPPDVTVKTLEKLMSNYGTVVQLDLHADTAAVGTSVTSKKLFSKDLHQRRRIAFVTFEEEGAASRALEAIHCTCPFETCNGVSLMAKLAEDNMQRSIRRATASLGEVDIKQFYIDVHRNTLDDINYEKPLFVLDNNSCNNPQSYDTAQRVHEFACDLGHRSSKEISIINTSLSRRTMSSDILFHSCVHTSTDGCGDVCDSKKEFPGRTNSQRLRCLSQVAPRSNKPSLLSYSDIMGTSLGSDGENAHKADRYLEYSSNRYQQARWEEIESIISLPNLQSSSNHVTPNASLNHPCNKDADYIMPPSRPIIPHHHCASPKERKCYDLGKDVRMDSAQRISSNLLEKDFNNFDVGALVNCTPMAQEGVHTHAKGLYPTQLNAHSLYDSCDSKPPPSTLHREQHLNPRVVLRPKSFDKSVTVGPVRESFSHKFAPTKQEKVFFDLQRPSRYQSDVPLSYSAANSSIHVCNSSTDYNTAVPNPTIHTKSDSDSSLNNSSKTLAKYNPPLSVKLRVGGSVFTTTFTNPQLLSTDKPCAMLACRKSRF